MYHTPIATHIPSLTITTTMHVHHYRMYGALTGMSKLMVGQKHGQKQLKLWRRSYATRPPQVSSFSSDYPGNDDR
jgi:bisphosphoglycerate-dependent phosphoglycerate mutase